MKITKYGHACVLVEQDEVKILVDPGEWSTVPELTGLDTLLITHEHQDHIDIEKISKFVSQNTSMVIFTNEHVGAILKEKNISYTRLQDGDAVDVKGVAIRGMGTEHDIVYGPSSPCENTGYLIHNELFIPGDALTVIPDVPVRVLALPTGGPWMKFSEAIDYAKKIAPSIVFPIHDAVYTEDVRRGMVPRLMGGHLEKVGIQFLDLKDGESIEP